MLRHLKLKKEIKIIDDEKLLEKYKAIWTMIENLTNTELNALPVFGDRYNKNQNKNIW